MDEGSRMEVRVSGDLWELTEVGSGEGMKALHNFFQ